MVQGLFSGSCIMCSDCLLKITLSFTVFLFPTRCLAFHSHSESAMNYELDATESLIHRELILQVSSIGWVWWDVEHGICRRCGDYSECWRKSKYSDTLIQCDSTQLGQGHSETILEDWFQTCRFGGQWKAEGSFLELSSWISDFGLLVNFINKKQFKNIRNQVY